MTKPKLSPSEIGQGSTPQTNDDRDSTINDRFRKDTKLRQDFASWLMRLIPLYLLGIGSVLLLAGFKCIPVMLSDKVLIALLCTTTANVLGLAAIALRGLFK